MAEIDPRVYKAQFDQAAANLLNAVANLDQLKAHQVQAEQEWIRAEGLIKSNAIAATDYDLDVANYKAAVANVEVGKATVEQCQAAKDMADINFKYCTITSPVKGVIIDRTRQHRPDRGLRLNASSLFLIAKDLKRIQVWASVNEADIGRIHVGHAGDLHRRRLSRRDLPRQGVRKSG